MTTETTIIIAACIAALPPTIMAYLSWRAGREASKKADVITEKATDIHSLANAQLTAVTTSLKDANEKIAGLERLVATFVKKRTRS